MKMFLTRLGENSRMIVTGDPSQVDLPPGQTSGLAEAMRLLDGVEGIGHATFTRRGRRPPRARGAHRRRLRQGRRGAQARGQGMSRPAASRPRQSRPRTDRRSTSSSIAALADAARLPKRSCERAIAAAAQARLQRRARELAIVLDRRCGDPRAQSRLARQGRSRPMCCRFRRRRPARRRGSAAPARRHRDRLRDDGARGARRGQAVRPSSRPSRGAWFSASARLRSRDRRARREAMERLERRHPGAARRARSLRARATEG